MDQACPGDLVQIGTAAAAGLLGVHVSTVKPICTVLPGRNDVNSCHSLQPRDLNLVHGESNSANCSKVAGQQS